MPCYDQVSSLLQQHRQQMTGVHAVQDAWGPSSAYIGSTMWSTWQQTEAASAAPSLCAATAGPGYEMSMCRRQVPLIPA